MTQPAAGVLRARVADQDGHCESAAGAAAAHCRDRLVSTNGANFRDLHHDETRGHSKHLLALVGELSPDGSIHGVREGVDNGPGALGAVAEDRHRGACLRMCVDRNDAPAS